MSDRVRDVGLPAIDQIIRIFELGYMNSAALRCAYNSTVLISQSAHYRKRQSLLLRLEQEGTLVLKFVDREVVSGIVVLDDLLCLVKAYT